jgi:hypothetical protein
MSDEYDEALQLVREAMRCRDPLITIRARLMKVDDQTRLANSDVTFTCEEADLAVGLLASAIFGIAHETGTTPKDILVRIGEYLRNGMSTL